MSWGTKLTISVYLEGEPLSESELSGVTDMVHDLSWLRTIRFAGVKMEDVEEEPKDQTAT